MGRCRRPQSNGLQRGFALIDLAATAGTVAVLVGLLLPGLAKTTKSGEAAVCLNNLRQMTLAWQMYTADNRDKFPGAYHGGFSIGLGGPERPWASGWLDWSARSDNTNTVFLTDSRYACLSPYLGADAQVFKCPADRYLSEAQRRLGWTQRARSISLNVAIGEGNAESGPWDSSGTFKHVRRLAEIVYPSPAETWLFQDEHPDSINDPCFFPPWQTSWVDIPASYHNGAGGVVFVDGHAELHAWHGNTVEPVRLEFFAPMPVERRDIDWLRYHTPRVGEIF